METNKKTQTTVQTKVAYRIGDFTSKVSIQPAIFEAVLAKKNFDESLAREVFRNLAVEGRESGAPDVSLFVQSKALLSIVPAEIANQVDFDIKAKGRTPVRFVNPVTNKATKLTTFTVLTDLLDVIHDGKSKDIHVSFASDYCKKRASKPDSVEKKCDLSHHVRERIITNFTAMFF